MKEYTVIAVIFVIFSVLLDRILKTRLTSDKRFWIFWAVMIPLTCVINGYLTWRPVVMYGEEFYLGIRLFTIPIEDFLYGFSLITANISLWEYFTKRNNKSKNPNVN